MKTPQWTKEGFKIKISQNDMKILGFLVTHQQRSGGGLLDYGQWYNGHQVRVHFPKMEEHEVQMSLARLVYTEWIELRGAEYAILPDTAERYEAEIKNTTTGNPACSQAFKNEALTGMDEHGKQSTLTRAALHRTERRNTSDGVFNFLNRVEKIKIIAKSLKISEKEAAESIKIGRIHICKGHGDTGEHVGIFSPHNGKGQKWQHRCKKCMAKIMRERRAKR